MASWMDSIKFDKAGLVPVIAQDYKSGRVLMLAWANAEALSETVSTGWGTYYSRSRAKLWRKGESSGNRQQVHAMQLDCDGDAVIYKVEQLGGIACHTGRESCFFRTLQSGGWHVTEPVLKDPEEMYKK